MLRGTLLNSQDWFLFVYLFWKATLHNLSLSKKSNNIHASKCMAASFARLYVDVIVNC